MWRRGIQMVKQNEKGNRGRRQKERGGFPEFCGSICPSRNPCSQKEYAESLNPYDCINTLPHRSFNGHHVPHLLSQKRFTKRRFV